MSDPASTRVKDLDDTDEWLLIIQAVPLRTIDDIANDREPSKEVPVLAVGMQPEPPPPPLPYTGPRWWQLHRWMLWNFGDWLIRRKKIVNEQGKHRLVRDLRKEVVYRPETGEAGSKAAFSAQKYIYLPRHARDVPRRIPAAPH